MVGRNRQGFVRQGWRKGKVGVMEGGEGVRIHD
jgi:hypothetical protein